MNNYDYPVGSDTADAPWNQSFKEPEYRCPECGSDSLIWSHKDCKGPFDDPTLICRKCWNKGSLDEFVYEYEYEPDPDFYRD